MSFNTEVKTSYESKLGGVVFKGSLPKSAVEQFDVYASLLAYWESKTPSTWSVVKGYIIANTQIVEEKTNIELSVNDLNFEQVKFMFDKYLNMATDFFTSPTKSN